MRQEDSWVSLASSRYLMTLPVTHLTSTLVLNYMVLLHEGGNEYKEGTTGCDNKEWKGKRVKGELSRCQDLGDGPLF